MPLGLSGSGLITGFDPTASGFGKVLQVVRATDGTQRTTTSTSFVDANLSVTITPQKSTSAVLLIWSASFQPPSSNRMRIQITDNSNNAISGAQDSLLGADNGTGQIHLAVSVAYATPATTSAVTFKARFRADSGGTATILNNLTTGQLYAIEVAA